MWCDFTALLTTELWGLNFAVTATFRMNFCYLFGISVHKRKWRGSYCSAVFDKQTAGDVSHPGVECPGTIPWGILWLAAPHGLAVPGRLPWPLWHLPEHIPFSRAALAMETAGWKSPGCCCSAVCCHLMGAKHCHSSCQECEGWAVGSVHSARV